MPACEHCNDLLLPYLYDLLEPADRRSLEDHLRACPECRATLARLKEKQALVAEATRGSFAGVVFQPPKQAGKPAPAERTSRFPVALGRWAVAAAVLFACATAAGAFGWGLLQHQQNEIARAERQLAEVQNEFNQALREVNVRRANAQDEIRVLNEQLDQLLADWDRAAERQRKVLKGDGVQVALTGPKNLQAGAANTLAVEVTPVPDARLHAKVVNARTKEVLFAQPLTGAGPVNLQLPPSLPVKPGDDLDFVVEAEGKDGMRVKERLALVHPEYVTHLTTDKPLYRPGEPVRFRSLTLDRFSLKPAQQDLHLRFRIVGPNNAEIFKTETAARVVADQAKQPLKGPDGEPLRGVGVGEFRLPKNLPGGQYALRVTEANGRFPEERRPFVVHRWQAPQFNKEVRFSRGSYGPGERVVLNGKVTHLAGAAPPPAGMPGMGGPVGMVQGNGIAIHTLAYVDGQAIADLRHTADAEGRFQVEFVLPPAIPRGEGVVTLSFHDGAAVETLVRPLPLVVRDLLVDFYPEGGNLVAGVPNRVYFQARTPLNKPADLRGRVVDRAGQEVASIQTLTDAGEPGINQGLGTFSFTPKAGETYELKLDAPLGLRKRFVLPKVKADGVVLHVSDGVFEKGLAVKLHSPQRPRDLLVGLYCRGKLLDHESLSVEADRPADVTLRPAADVGGVCRVTVFEKRSGDQTGYVPLAERLVFRRQPETVRVAIQASRDRYAPGDRVRLDLEARDAKKERVPAVALVAVVDDSVFKLADEKTARSLPTHFLLTTEVRRPEDLENADALLGNHPKAEQALDLLLGAQGWRRFAEQNPRALARRLKGQPPAFLAAAQPTRRAGADDRQRLAEVDRPYAERFVNIQKQLAAKERRENASPEMQARQLTAQARLNQQRDALELERQRAGELQRFLGQAALGIVGCGVLLFAFFLVSVGLSQLASGQGGLVYLGGGACLLTMFFAIAVVSTFALIGHEDPRLRFGHRQPAVAAAKAMPVPPPPADVPPPGMAAPGMEVPPLALDWQAAPVAELEAKQDEAAVAFDPGPEPMPMPPGKMDDILIARPGLLPLVHNDERSLRAQGRFDDLLQQRLGRRVALPPAHEPGVVREYAHQFQQQPDQVRRDFEDVLFWHPVLVLPDGKAHVEFDLADAATRYRVLVVSHTLDGRLGSDVAEVSAQLPYRLDPQTPTEVTNTDTITLPVAVANDTERPTTLDLKLRTKGLQPLEGDDRHLSLAAGQKKRAYYRLQPTITEGEASVRLLGRFAPKGSDAVERTFQVVPDGIPVEGSVSGLLENVANHEITLPDSWVPGSLRVRVQVYPSTLADLQQGLEALLREPHGCFEQASSSNYPNVMALNYLKETNQANLALEERSRELLDRGYRKLTSFECADPARPDVKRGYEWFGQTAPPHEALTAYGLLQFRDMAKVYPVDEAMLKRTQQYLLDQRDGKGGFRRNPRAVDSFGRAPQRLTDAYVIWALTESGTSADLSRELAALSKQAQASRDPYFLALVALGHLNANQTEEAFAQLQRLRGLQKDAGQLEGTTTSITGSAGRDLAIETTALTTLAWLKANRPDEFHGNIHRAAQWLTQQRGGPGNFGSTQATILALKALLAYARENRQAAEPGELQVTLSNEQNFEAGAARARLPGRAQEPIAVTLREAANVGQMNLVPGLPPQPALEGAPGGPVASSLRLAPGRNNVQVSLTGRNHFPYTLSWSYRTLRPANAPDCPVRLTARLAKRELREGETVKLTAAVENRTGKEQGMTVAVLGLPGGLALPEDFAQLKELTRPHDDGTKPGVLGAWELRGRELVLYWRHLPADAKKTVELDLLCRLPGSYRGPASRAYLYYNADDRFWVEPLQVNIQPRAGAAD